MYSMPFMTMYVSMYSMYVCMHVGRYAFMYVCMYVCVYACVQTMNLNSEQGSPVQVSAAVGTAWWCSRGA